MAVQRVAVLPNGCFGIFIAILISITIFAVVRTLRAWCQGDGICSIFFLCQCLQVFSIQLLGDGGFYSCCTILIINERIVTALFILTAIEAAFTGVRELCFLVRIVWIIRIAWVRICRNHHIFCRSVHGYTLQCNWNFLAGYGFCIAVLHIEPLFFVPPLTHCPIFQLVVVYFYLAQVNGNSEVAAVRITIINVSFNGFFCRRIPVAISRSNIDAEPIRELLDLFFRSEIELQRSNLIA